MRLRSTGLGVAAALLALAAQASQVRPVNLEELTERAARIFAGRCVETQVVRDAVRGGEVHLATFEVDRMVKGEAAGRVTVRMLDLGAAAFRPGEEVVLFLYGESVSGLTSPVGLGQGRFNVVTDKQGRRIAVNALANRNLMRDLSARALSRLGSSIEGWTERKDLEPAALLDMAAALVAAQP